MSSDAPENQAWARAADENGMTISLAPPIPDARDELAAVLRGGVRALYQPIVELDTAQVIAYEALARGPVGSPLESPLALFDAARAQGRVVELDWACRAAAVSGVLSGRGRPAPALFVNAEPEALTAVAPDPAQAELVRRAIRESRVVIEVTERAITLRPARLRAAGFGIALDDVGADRRSLALLPLLRPDIVKLDISLIHNHPSRMSGEVMNGVCAYAEQSGAAIVAEGIESERHLLAARSLGATLGQGWFYGRPAALPDRPTAGRPAAPLGISPRRVPESPVALVHAQRGLRTGRKDVLLSVSRALEAQARDLGAHAVVVASFQDGAHFTPATRERYRQLGSEAAFVAALGVGMDPEPAPGVRGADLEPDDVLRGEWDIAVLGPHFAGALVARDLGDAGPDWDRRFEFVLTFDRELVIDVAAALIARVNAAVPALIAPRA